MGANTSTQGGGAATGVANDFQSFLRQQLTGQNQNQQQNWNPFGSNGPFQTNPGMSDAERQARLGSLIGIRSSGLGNMDSINQEIGRLQSNAQQPGNQVGAATGGQYGSLGGTGILQNGSNGAPPMFVGPNGSGGGGGGFMGAYNNALSGQTQDPSGAFAHTQNYFASNPSQPTYTNQFTSPTYRDPSLTQLGTDFGHGVSGQADIGKYLNTPQSSFQAQYAQGLQNPSSGYDPQLIRSLAQSSNFGSGGGQNGFNAASLASFTPSADVSLRDASAINANSPEIAAANHWAGVERNRAAADQRARFGAAGAGALGTGAQYAEGTLNADFANRNANTTYDLINRAQQFDLADRQARAQTDLTSRGQTLQSILGGRGQDSQLGIANMQGGIQGAQNQNQFDIAAMGANVTDRGNTLSALGQARGQDFQAGLGVRGQNIDQNNYMQGLGSQQSIANTNSAVNSNGQNLQALLNNQQMGNNWASGNQQINNNAQQLNNANSLNSTQFLNNFNQNNAQNFAQYGQANNALNSNNFNNMYNQNMNNGQIQNQMSNNNIQSVLQQLFGSFNQQSALGTPQAQLVSRPSGASQGLSAGLGLLGSYLAGGGNFGGLFGRGGGGVGSPTNPVPMGAG